jgi:hypothetical protein
VNKSNIDSNPGDIKIEISNKVLDITDTTTSLLNRQRINDVYAQGATNIDSNDYQDNCDNTHPATIEFYIPHECVRVNKCMLTFKTEKFRAYERGSLIYQFEQLETAKTDGASWLISEEPGIPEVMELVGNHDHGGMTGYASGEGLPSHSHTISEVVAHAHGLVPHKHKFQIPDHKHNIEYGIFEFEEIPQSVTIKVDGNTIPYNGNQGTDIDLVPYLSTDSDGKIERGVFHKVEIFPDVDNTINPETGLARNPLGLARIVAQVVKQIFVQSRGGGDY